MSLIIILKTTIEGCHKEAPIFWKENDKYLEKNSRYGLLEYDKDCDVGNAVYYIASKEKFENSSELNLKPCNYLVFECDYEGPDFLYEFCNKIYRTIIPNSGYELEKLPDIEEYLPDKKLRLYIPIK